MKNDAVNENPVCFWQAHVEFNKQFSTLFKSFFNSLTLWSLTGTLLYSISNCLIIDACLPLSFSSAAIVFSLPCPILLQITMKMMVMKLETMLKMPQTNMIQGNITNKLRDGAMCSGKVDVDWNKQSLKMIFCNKYGNLLTLFLSTLSRIRANPVMYNDTVAWRVDSAPG